MVVSVSVKWNVIVKLLMVLQSSSKKDYLKFQIHIRKLIQPDSGIMNFGQRLMIILGFTFVICVV